MFEVEKKFKIPADFTRVLLEQGWKYLKEVHLKDTYFDTECYELTRKNYWLRKRHTKWQLKCPTQEEKDRDAVRIDRYQEIEEEKAIIDCLAFVPKAKGSSIVGKTTDTVVEIFGLKPIAQFESFRSKYQLDSFTIDLDKTNFGYELGEIEVMCENKGEMQQATANIFDMAKKLGKLKRRGNGTEELLGGGGRWRGVVLDYAEIMVTPENNPSS
jgi:adenylate cyclase class IV